MKKLVKILLDASAQRETDQRVLFLLTALFFIHHESVGNAYDRDENCAKATGASEI